MAPADVQQKNKNSLWVRLFGDEDTHLKPQILQGAMVLESSHKEVYDNGYMANWTKKDFTVSKAMPPKRWTKRLVYKLVN